MRALEGIKVVDFSKWLPGQYCGMVLADFGADVVKVESKSGDPNRRFEPQAGPGLSSWNMALNRNKKGFAADLRTEEGIALVKDLIAQADVLLEGFRPGYMEKKGLGWEKMHEINPRLIYCSLSGFGQEGKYRSYPAHDLNIVGLSGMDFLNDKKDVALSEVQVSALGTSLNAVAAISMALLARERGAGGQHIDVNLFDTALAMQIVPASSIMMCKRRGGTHFGRRAHYYDVYPTKDHRFLSVGTIEPKFWQRFCQISGLEDLAERQFDFDHAEEITKAVRDKVASKTLAEWEQILGDEEICVTPVRSLPEAMSSDMAKEADMLALRNEDVGEVDYVKPAIKMSDTPGEIRFRGPYLGEHTEEILAKIGYTGDKIRSLREKGVI